MARVGWRAGGPCDANVAVAEAANHIHPADGAVAGVAAGIGAGRGAARAVERSGMTNIVGGAAHAVDTARALAVVADLVIFAKRAVLLWNAAVDADRGSGLTGRDAEVTGVGRCEGAQLVRHATDAQTVVAAHLVSATHGSCLVVGACVDTKRGTRCAGDFADVA